MADPLRLFDGRFLRATLFGSGPGLFATFDNYVPGKAGFGTANPSRKVLEAGFSHLVLQTARNDWYLNADLGPLQAVLRDRFKGGAAAKAMGFSMGAFGAILLAGALGLGAPWLISPRFPRPLGWPGMARVNCDPALLPADWQQLVAAAVADLPGGVVLYDAAHADDRSALRWMQGVNGRISAAGFAFGGHPCTSYVKDSNRFAAFQEACLAPAAGLGNLIRVKRLARAHSPLYRAKRDAYLAARQARNG